MLGPLFGRVGPWHWHRVASPPLFAPESHATGSDRSLVLSLGSRRHATQVQVRVRAHARTSTPPACVTVGFQAAEELLFFSSFFFGVAGLRRRPPIHHYPWALHVGAQMHAFVRVFPYSAVDRR